MIKKNKNFLKIKIKKNTENTEKYLFLDDIWNIIKDYAGIYSIKMDWDKKLPIINPIIHIVNVFCLSTEIPEYWNWGDLTDYRGSLQQRINIIKKTFWKKHRKISFPKSVFLYLQQNLFPDNKLWRPPTNLKIGDEIIFRQEISKCGCSITYNWLCGIINKINMFNIDVDVYKYEIIPNYYNYNTNNCNIIYYKKAFLWKKNEPTGLKLKITKNQINCDTKFINKSKLFTHGLEECLYYHNYRFFDIEEEYRILSLLVDFEIY